MEYDCRFVGKIDHSEVAPKFRDSLFACKLYEKRGVGMHTLGIVCGHCCIRSAQIGEKLTEMIMKKEITYEDLERDPNCFIERLPENLQVYAKVVSEESGLDFVTIQRICTRCNPLPVNPQTFEKSEPTKMSYVGRRDV